MVRRQPLKKSVTKRTPVLKSNPSASLKPKLKTGLHSGFVTATDLLRKKSNAHSFGRASSMALTGLSVKHRIETQISVLSSDSGILPKEIQNSSFVEDVIGELNDRGISHADIFHCQEHDGCNSPQVAQLSSEQDNTAEKISQEITDGHVVKKKGAFSEHTMGAEIIKRQKNNEASRRSRASHKNKIAMQEKKIAGLEEENQWLSILLTDFTSVVATCKQWIVQKMETDGN